MKLNPFISLAVLTIILLCGCDPNDVTIYNNYEGNPNDSTGYYNIFYHDFEPDIVLDSLVVSNNDPFNPNNNTYSLDLNNDVFPDIEFSYGTRFQGNGYSSINDNGWRISNGFANVLRDVSCVYQIPAVNSANNSITGISAGLANLEQGYLIQGSPNPNFHNWYTSQGSGENYLLLLPCNSLGQDVYIGFRSIEDLTNDGYGNYAWLKMNVSTDGKVLTLKEYAYNLIPNSPIRVGDK
jgi:hypothetical protein